MKRITIFLSIIAISLFTLASCYYDSEEFLYPTLNSSCDTLNVTFSRSIVPVLSNNCLSCHSNATAQFGGNIRLENFADVKINAARIVPVVTHAGVKPMPPNGQLKDCAISMIKIWIKDGMPNN